MNNSEVLPPGCFHTSGIVEFIGPKIIEIGSSCFANADRLKRVEISSSLTKIPNYCFYNCKSLESFNMPDNLKEIGYQSFFRSGVKQIITPKSLVKLPKSCFAQSALEKIKFDGEMQSIEELAF
jgi:hypothetical protein